MRNVLPAALITLAWICGQTHGYIEAPHTLGLVCRDSTNIVLMEVVRVNKEKGLIIYRKVEDLKGKHDRNEIKHNIGKRGFHEREWQNVMNWAKEGNLALFFHNGGASETCIGTYWYQSHPEGEWWAMSHAEPFLLRTFHGRVEKLAAHVKAILQNKEVVVTALQDGNMNDLHLRKGKLIRMKASLKRIEWNARRDFAGVGPGDGDDDVQEYKTIILLADGSDGWRFLPAADNKAGDRWRAADFNDRDWRTGKAPIGYGEDEIKKRKGTWVKEEGVPFIFRRAFEVSADVLKQKDVTFHLAVASDDSAEVYINGQLADREEPEVDHEFAYWNRDVEVPAKLFRSGGNVVAVLVRNKPKSSDIYMDLEITAQVPLPRVKLKPVKSKDDKDAPAKGIDLSPPTGDAKNPAKLTIDEKRKAVIVPAVIALRKLPKLNDIYPLEVVATYPSPRGQKAHETVVSFTDIRPSEVHRALEKLGLKAGKPARGEGMATGPEVRVLLEYVDAGGKTRSAPIESLMVDRKTGQKLPPLRWLFTGSAIKQPDPEKDDKVYGADLSGTLIAIFPVTDDTVLQSSLTMKDEPRFRLERIKGLPAEGTAVKIVIEAK